MVTGGFQYTGSVSKADDVAYSGILTLNKAEGTNTAKNMYFKGTDSMTVIGETGDERWTDNLKVIPSER